MAPTANCPSYSPLNSINQPSLNNGNLPTILIANVRSVNGKVDELNAICNVNNIDIMCITETWLKQCIPDTAVSLPNFALLRNDRLSSLGGGVCAFVHHTMKVRRIQEFENSNVESIWISIRPKRLPRSISVILLAVVYHSTSCNAVQNLELYNHIQQNVDLFLSNHPDALVMVTGDFNPVSTGFSDKRIKQLTGLTQIINIATRQNSILDWCLTNKKDLDFQIIPLPPVGSSDHNSILIKSCLFRESKPPNDRVLKRDLRDSNVRPFGQWITCFNWSDVFEIHDCNLKFAKFNDILSDKIDYYFPLNLTNVRKSDKPWITSSLKLFIKKRQHALHAFGKSSEIYKKWRNKVQVEVKSARDKYYHSTVKKLKTSNTSRWWKEIKLLGGLSSHQTWFHQLLSDDYPTCSELAESYNDFLVGLTAHFKPLVCRDVSEEIQPPDHLLIGEREVYSALRRIKTTKSPGPDGIPNKLLKIFALELAPVICHIYNSSLQQGTFPQNLKRSLVVPIPKTSHPRSMEEDLRPISLTAQIGKIMEGFILDSLLVEVSGKLDKKQFALPNKSTTQALVYFMHLILSGLDKGNCSARLFFADFRKGFDLVDHNVIIAELENLGVHPVIIRWISSFLTDREQCVKIGNSISSWKKLNGGLPQGTKLGPLLFVILINSLLVDWHGRIKFVDDSSFLEVIPRCSPCLLPSVVNDISRFAAKRGMELNSKKCKEMVVSFLKYELTRFDPIYISGLPVERVSCFKLLGVTISDDLTWNAHVDSVLKKANSRLYALRQLKKAGLSEGDLVNIYCSFLRPCAEYASPVWSNLTECLSKLIESIQKRALRTIYPFLSYENALSTAGLDTLENRRHKACLKFAEKMRCDNQGMNPLADIFHRISCVKDYGYDLRSVQPSRRYANTERFNKFITVKYY